MYLDLPTLSESLGSRMIRTACFDLLNNASSNLDLNDSSNLLIKITNAGRKKFQECVQDPRTDEQFGCLFHTVPTRVDQLTAKSATVLLLLLPPLPRPSIRTKTCDTLTSRSSLQGHRGVARKPPAGLPPTAGQ